MKEIYLDNAATTPISDAVLTEMTDKLQNVYGNASTLYGLGESPILFWSGAGTSLRKALMRLMMKLCLQVVELKVIILPLFKRRLPEKI